MKKNTFAKGLAALLIAAAVLAIPSCTRNGKGDTPTQKAGYNYDSVVTSDYNTVKDMYTAFRFLEVDAEFQDLVSDNPNPTVTYIRTVFQHGDTCIIIEHPKNAFDREPEITKTHDHWLGCADMAGERPISLDSCMTIVKPYAKDLPTRHLTFRRIMGPPFPMHAEYILGHGLLFVDCRTGAVRGDNAQGYQGQPEAAAASM